MPEQFLDDPQVGAALEEVRGERVAKGVRRHGGGEAGPTCRGPNDREGLLARQSPTPVPEEERPAPHGRPAMQRQERWAIFGEPAIQPVDRDVADRNEPLLV